MALLTFNDTSTDEQGLVQALRDISGQDSLSIQKATRYLNFALDRYSVLALEASGRWKWDATTHVNDDSERTRPIATAVLAAGEDHIPLEADQLTIERVTFDGNILSPIDNRDYQTQTPAQIYGNSGTPQYFDYDAGALVFYPSGNGGTVEILFGRAAPHFSVDDTDVDVGIPGVHQEFLVLYAAYKLTFRTQDSGRSQLKEDLKEAEDDIKEFFSNRERTRGRRLVPKKRGNAFAPR